MTAHPVGKQRGAVAGYSGTPLAKKLGIKPGGRVAVVSAPNGFTEALRLPPRSQLRTQARGRVDVVVFFVTRGAELARRFPSMQRCLEEHGGLWIAWPKRASGVPTDLNEHVVRDFALTHGRVDVKVCAIDEVWTGFKHVIRKVDR